jgi:hypothetical protein
MSTNKIVLSDEQKAALTEDANNRGVRAIWQGLSVDVLIAVALLVTNILTDANGWSDLDWKIIGFTLMKTVLMAVAAFVMRRYLDGSKVPTPLPPTPVPAPSTPAGEAVDFDNETAPSLIADDDLDEPVNPTGSMPEGVDIPGGEPAESNEDIDAPTDFEQAERDLRDLRNQGGGL